MKHVDFVPGVGGAFDFCKRGIQVVQLVEDRLVVRSKVVVFLSGHSLQPRGCRDGDRRWDRRGVELLLLASPIGAANASSRPLPGLDVSLPVRRQPPSISFTRAKRPAPAVLPSRNVGAMQGVIVQWLTVKLGPVDFGSR